MYFYYLNPEGTWQLRDDVAIGGPSSEVRFDEVSGDRVILENHH